LKRTCEETKRELKEGRWAFFGITSVTEGGVKKNKRKVNNWCVITKIGNSDDVILIYDETLD